MTDIIVNILFYLFSCVLLFSAVSVILSRDPVHSALYLILAFFNAAALFLLAGAEFLAMILLVVYVGAVMVLFLFVVMMLGAKKNNTIIKGYHGILGLFVGATILVEIICALVSYKFNIGNFLSTGEPMASSSSSSNTEALGLLIYTNYAFYFEIAGVILLVAMICSIVLSLTHRKNVKRQLIEDQVSRSPETSIEIKKVDFNKGI